jgi:parvulin-like peptidyl-prolyl isomerase
LVLGAALFALHSLVAGPGSSASDKTIRITDGDVRRLVAAWQLQWRRPPSGDELANLLDDHVREEILYREALALGLEQNDQIIRRRLAQKMQFLSEDAAEDRQPTRAELQTFFEENAERFRQPARTTFTHVYYSPDQRGARALEDAKRDLERLHNGESAGGDPFMLQLRYVDQIASQLASQFGQPFADALFELPAGSWQGPVESGYGLHLLHIDSKTEERPASFEEVEAEVRAAYLDQARREANESFYERLRASYTIETDPEVSFVAAERRP